MHKIVLGLENAKWEDFVKFLQGKEWEAAVRSASAAQLRRAIDELDLEEEKIIKVAESFGTRFKKSRWGGYSDDIVESSMEEEEFHYSVSTISGALKDKGKSLKVRLSLLGALKSAVEANLDDNSLQICVEVLTKGLQDELPVPYLCAEMLSILEENHTYADIFKDTVVPALEDALKRLGSQQEPPEHRGKIEDAIEMIRYGKVRDSTEYRKYLGDGEVLRVPMFTERPVPTTIQKRKHGKGRKKLKKLR